MTVNEAYEALGKLIDQGHGFLELIETSSQGDTSSVDIYPRTREVDGSEEMGELCDWDVGIKYVPIHTGN